MKLTRLLLVFGLIGWFSTVDAAILQVGGGTHQIENKPGQVIDLYVTGGAEIAGFDLALQIGAGAAGPKITWVDLESGIFAGNHSGQTDNGSSDRTAFYSISSAGENPPVLAEGLLMRVTFDATGTPEGVYSLAFEGIEIPGFGVADSEFTLTGPPVSATFLPGTITVVPEPGAACAMGVLALAVCRRRRAH